MNDEEQKSRTELWTTLWKGWIAFWKGLRRALRWGPIVTWTLIFALAVAYIVLVSRAATVDRIRLTLGLTMASFAIGSVAGFLFSSYGEETATIGKIRDWLIGGITGVTIVKASSIQGLLEKFAAGTTNQEFAMTVADAVTFAVLGFFFMFFQRELIINVLLAQRRAERSRLDGTQQAELAITQTLQVLPPNLLSGVEDVDELLDGTKPEAERIEKLIDSDDVTKFLEGADEEAASGRTLGWDIVSMAAHLNYYRTYTAKGDDKEEQAERARQWLLRALMINPHHVDFTAKYADILAMQKQYNSAVKVLEELYDSPDAPAYIEQWLGYFLLWVDREEEAIKLSEDYHRRFPDDDSGLFNAACGYAQLYEKELKAKGVAEDLQSSNRKKALELLKSSLKMQPPDERQALLQKYSTEDESFYALRQDSEFLSIAGTPVAPGSKTTSSSGHA